MNDIIRENFGGDRNTFIKTLQAQNYSLSEFSKDEYEKIIVAAMRGKNVKPTTIASPAKIRGILQEAPRPIHEQGGDQAADDHDPEQGGEGNAAAQKAMAEEILGKLAGGADFARMAQMYSEDSTRDHGRRLGLDRTENARARWRKWPSVSRSKKVSNIIELGGNYYILKVDEKRGGVTNRSRKSAPRSRRRSSRKKRSACRKTGSPVCAQKASIRTF